MEEIKENLLVLSFVEKTLFSCYSLIPFFLGQSIVSNVVTCFKPFDFFQFVYISMEERREYRVGWKRKR